MKKQFFNTLFVLAFSAITSLLPSICIAQNCCCCNSLNYGKKAYEVEKYNSAYKYWLTGRDKCPDAQKCPELRDSIKNVKKKIDLLSRVGTRIKVFFEPKRKTPPPPPPPYKGTYHMGDQYTEGDMDEKPHSITVSVRNFWVSPTETTFEEYDAFCHETGRDFPHDNGWGRGQRPVINVNWYDAVEYCNWRSAREKLKLVYSIKKEKRDPNNKDFADTLKWEVICNWKADGYRLPTEAEWEYSAREVDKLRKIRFGNDFETASPSEINFDARPEYIKRYSTVGNYRQKTIPVDSLDANALGRKHFSGNVSEWCWDWYGECYYDKSGGAVNPRGPASGSNRVSRGGSWRDTPRNCRITYRKALQPIYQGSDVGFRIVKKKTK